MPKTKRKTKACVGCQDQFLTYRNYDYCQHCAINNSRYAQNHCPECGDGSGVIKFKNQKSRPCKVCHLTTVKRKSLRTTKNPEEQFWNQVETTSKSLIANLTEKILPISALPQVFDLEKSSDYRELLRDDLPNYYQESAEYQEKIAQQSWTKEDVEAVSEDLTCAYFDLVVKNLIEWLSDYQGFESTRLANYEY